MVRSSPVDGNVLPSPGVVVLTLKSDMLGAQCDGSHGTVGHTVVLTVVLALGRTGTQQNHAVMRQAAEAYERLSRSPFYDTVNFDILPKTKNILCHDSPMFKSPLTDVQHAPRTIQCEPV